MTVLHDVCKLHRVTVDFPEAPSMLIVVVAVRRDQHVSPPAFTPTGTSPKPKDRRTDPAQKRTAMLELMVC